MKNQNWPQIVLILLVIICLSCKQGSESTTEAHAYSVGEVVSYEDISPDIYFAGESNDRIDPNHEMIQSFRDRKSQDLSNPKFPQPFNSVEDQAPPKTIGSKIPWDDVKEVFRFDWDKIDSEFKRIFVNMIKVKTVLDHADIKIREMSIAADGVLPKHVDRAPGVYHILDGNAIVWSDGQSVKTCVGTSIKLESWSPRSIRVTSDTPLKVLWISWAPGGQQDYLNAGYYLTGSNFHVQAKEAILPDDYQHWALGQPLDCMDTMSIKSKIVNNKFYERAYNRLEQDKKQYGESQGQYPMTPLFSTERDIDWLDFTNINVMSFFWAKDASKGKDMLSAWNKIARMKGVFQAKVPEGQYDLNFSYIAIGSHGKYVTHSHATPEFYYILGGRTEWILNGVTSEARAGDLYFHSPYQDHEMRVLSADKPMRAITGSWAPFGDRSVFNAPFYLLGDIDEIKTKAQFPENWSFYSD